MNIQENFDRYGAKEINDVRDLPTALLAGVKQPFRQHAGNVFYLDEATSPVYVSFDNKKEIKLVQGQKVAIDYQGFVIRSDAAQSVRVKHGYGHFSNSNQQVSVNATAVVEGANTTKPGAEVSVGAGATVLLLAANPNRKSWRLAVPSNQPNEVYLTDALNTAKGGILEPGMVDKDDSTAAVYAHNYGASAVLVSVLEAEKV